MDRLSLTGWGRAVVAVAAAMLWAQPPAARAQEAAVQVSIARLGLGGKVRPGDWTPMLLRIESRLPGPPRQVICEWTLTDLDGDRLQHRRRAPMQRGENFVWLYAMVPVNTGPAVRWSVRVVEVADPVQADADADSGRTLAVTQAGQADLLSMRQAVIGILGSSADLGLEPYEPEPGPRPLHWTQHEGCLLLRGLEARDLPDKWHGLSMMQALIWTSAAGSPDGPAMTAEVRKALRQWVQRGGHLVVVLPEVGQAWTSSSLADLLPSVSVTRRPVAAGAVAPAWLGTLSPADYQSMAVNVLEPLDPSRASVLLRDGQGQPLVVAGQYGLGRVTLIGLDLTHPVLARAGLPWPYFPTPDPRGQRLWPTVFGWRGPLFTREAIEADRNAPEPSLVQPGMRLDDPLDRNLIPGLIGMRGTAAPALLAAVLVFTLYWLLAGPVGFAALRRRGLQRHSWLLFAAMVAVFTLLSWGGALLLRPRETRIEHFTVLDVDAGANLVRTRTWLSLATAGHGLAEVALPVDPGLGSPTVASPGLSAEDAPALGLGTPGFVDPRLYHVQAAQPAALSVPMRGTAKQFEVDYLGSTAGGANPLGRAWGLPQGRFHVDSTGDATGVRLRGSGRHQLPGALVNVRVVYCPGDGQEPWAWRVDNWPPGQDLAIDAGFPAEGQTTPLARRMFWWLPDNSDPRGRACLWRGYLADLLAGHGAEYTPESLDDAQRAVLCERLAFFSVLPPPTYWARRSGTGPDMTARTNYVRRLGRSIDLSSLLSLRRVIILGHLAGGPLPTPLTVDGQTAPSRGWTFVRWIVPIEEAPGFTTPGPGKPAAGPDLRP